MREDALSLLRHAAAIGGTFRLKEPASSAAVRHRILLESLILAGRLLSRRVLILRFSLQNSRNAASVGELTSTRRGLEAERERHSYLGLDPKTLSKFARSSAEAECSKALPAWQVAAIARPTLRGELA